MKQNEYFKLIIMLMQEVIIILLFIFILLFNPTGTAETLINSIIIILSIFIVISAFRTKHIYLGILYTLIILMLLVINL